MSIKFDTFKTDVAQTYLTHGLRDEDFWIFGSFAGEEEKPVSLNTEKVQREFLRKSIFGVNVTDLDFVFLANLNPWNEGTVYTQFDDSKVLLTDSQSPFYMTTLPETEGGSYHIFKCIENNYESPSTVKPVIETSINALNGLYYLADGYVWKYMLSVPSFLYRKFGGTGYIPIIRNQQVEQLANEGLYSILVENRNTNFGYERLTGRIENIETNNRVIVQITGNIPFNKVPNIYLDRTLIVTPATGSQISNTQYYRITGSGELGVKNFITLDIPDINELNLESSIEIVPTIELIGDGTGALAIPVFNEENNRIISVRIVLPGQGYQNIKARVLDPSFNFDPTNPNRLDVECILKPIISPVGGHGSDPVNELKCKNICISVNITSRDLSRIPATNTYSKIGLIKNPVITDIGSDVTLDGRLKLVLTEPATGLIVGDTVSQQNGVSGIIHEIDNDTIYLTEYTGPYSVEFDSDLSINNERGLSFNINTIVKSKYTPNTGIVLFVTDITPVERLEEKVEQIKLIVDL